MSDAAPHGIVLLEDDDLDAELIATRLTADGVTRELRRARDERGYLELLRRGDVALVLSDFSLPSYGGIAALEAAREHAPDAPFIFVSGAIGEELAIDTMRRGATDYVLKSRLERLGPAVHRALAEAETRRLREHAERERDRLLVAERQAREAAEAANRMKDDFLALVSHELRTPLNAILGWATLLSAARSDGHPLDDDKVDRALSTIVRNAQVQSRIIEDILDISRIVSGKLNLKIGAARVDTFVMAAVEAVRPAAAAKRLELDVHVASDAGEIVADADRLQQVVWNLVTNAVKFTGPGGVVRLSARRVGDALTIEVADTGNGIEPALLPYVFERFRQGDASKTRRHGGLGLGLAIVRHLVEMHGGTVAAASDGPGRGASFTVSLPIRATQPPAEAPAAPHAEDGVSTSPLVPDVLAGARVLIVDDDPDARELVREVLRASGAETATAGSVLDAIRALDAERFDVVVSDIGMPHVDGYSLMRRLRARPPARGGAVPAIALTAYARDVDRTDAERVGYQRHLAKPIAPEVLVAAVAELVGRTAPVA